MAKMVWKHRRLRAAKVFRGREYRLDGDGVLQPQPQTPEEIASLRRHPNYVSVTAPDEPVEEKLPKDWESMTTENMKVIAKRVGVQIKGIRRKSDLIDAIKECLGIEVEKADDEKAEAEE